MLVDDGKNEWYTVIGFWWETMERWADSYLVDTPLAAEEAAQEFARSRFAHLGVVSVLKGKLHEDIILEDRYATWIDPYCKSQEQMDATMAEAGYWEHGRYRAESQVKKQPEKKKLFGGW